MNIRDTSTRPRVLAVVGLVAALLLVVLAVRQINRLSGRGKVWVASAGMGPGSMVAEQDLRLASVRRSDLPEGVLRERSQIQGRQLARRKQEGTPFTASDFRAADNTRSKTSKGLADEIPEGRVLMPLRMTPSLFPSARLRRGDRIDIIASTREGETELVVRDGFLLGQNRRESVSPARGERKRGPFGIDLGLSGERSREAPLYFYLALHPEDALSLSRAQGDASTLRVIMHSRDDVRAGRVADLGADKQLTVELIRGGDRETVPVAY